MRHTKPFTLDQTIAEQESSLSIRLKLATAAIHHEIEHGSDINQKIVERDQGNGYKDIYRQFLLSAYGFENAVLEKIRQFNPSELAAAKYPPEETVATDLILDDLNEVNDVFDLGKLQTMPGLPEIRSLAELAGMEYVRRGSRNGNSYIARIVKHNLDIGAENGASFLNLDGNQVHPRWNAFKQWLDSLEFTDDEASKAVDAAIATFRAVGEWHKKG